jgi:hypothetical protein
MRFWINLEIQVGKLELEARTDRPRVRPWGWRNVGKYSWAFGWLWFAASWDR